MIKEEHIYITLTILIVVAAYIVMPTVREMWSGVDRDLTEPEPEWCLVADLPPSGGDWSENHAGAYEYQVIATQSGFKVFQRCSKI